MTTEEEEYKAVLEAFKSGDDDSARTKMAWYKLSGVGGCEVDADDAVVLLEERVKDRDPEAMWMLGVCYEFGLGCEEDCEHAKTLFKQSSDNGNVVGLFFSENLDSMGENVLMVKSLY